jgi:glycoprotein 6-alpha-L-fucosyltransferase
MKPCYLVVFVVCISVFSVVDFFGSRLVTNLLMGLRAPSDSPAQESWREAAALSILDGELVTTPALAPDTQSATETAAVTTTPAPTTEAATTTPTPTTTKGAAETTTQTTTRTTPRTTTVTTTVTTRTTWKSTWTNTSANREMSHKAKLWFHNRIRQLQFPSSCDATNNHRYIRCTLGGASKICGFGCQMHHLVICMMLGFKTNRTVVLNMKDWPYSKTTNCTNSDEWLCFFQPASSCVVTDLDHGMRFIGNNNGRVLGKEVDVPEEVIDMGTRQNVDYLDLYSPPELQAILKQHNKKEAHLWLAGHFVGFLLRLNDEYRALYEETKTRIGFTHPILGMHVRGDDKWREAKLHGLDEYIQMSPPGYSLIYLATDDDRTLLRRSQFPNITFIRASGEKVNPSQTRFAQGAFANLIFDVLMLAECDVFVGTESSNIGRLVYEKMQANYLDSMARAVSIETIIRDNKRTFEGWYLD